MLRRSLLAALTLTVLAAFSACENGGAGTATPPPLPEPLAIETPAPGAEFRTHEAEVEMRIRGALQLEFRETIQIHVTEMMGPELPEATWFFQVGFAQPIFLDEVSLLHVGFDLAPGLFRGAGSYELTAERVTAFEGGEALTSGVVVRMSYLEEGRIDEFRDFVEPCALEFTEKAVVGSLECPEVASDEGQTISLDWSWTLV